MPVRNPAIRPASDRTHTTPPAPARSVLNAIVPGRQFGHLTALRIDTARHDGEGRHTYWRCRCDCGREVAVRGSKLRAGRIKSCGHARGGRNGNAPKGGRPINMRLSDASIEARDTLAKLWKCDATMACEIALQYLARLALDGPPAWLDAAPAVLLQNS